MDEIGYDAEWEVLNSKYFGVPQNRERVFIVGHLRGEPWSEVFPLGCDGEATDELPRYVSNTLTRRYDGAQTVGTYIGESELSAQIHQRPRGNNAGGLHDIAPTLTKNSWQDNNHVVEPILGGLQKLKRMRRLTPIECERLQGFPDGWTKYGGYKKAGDIISKNPEHGDAFGIISDSQRYKCLGNAVTVNVVQAIMEKILLGTSLL